MLSENGPYLGEANFYAVCVCFSFCLTNCVFDVVLFMVLTLP